MKRQLTKIAFTERQADNVQTQKKINIELINSSQLIICIWQIVTQ